MLAVDHKSSQRSTDRHPFNGLSSITTWVSRHQKGQTSLDESGDDGVAVASAGPYANHFHLTSLHTDNHATTAPLDFYKPYAFYTESKKEATILLPVTHETLTDFWATVCKTVHPMILVRCLSVLSVTLAYCGQTVGWIKMKLVMQ